LPPQKVRMQASCLACELMSGARDLPGGRIRSTRSWAVEHCVGPLGVGTLLVKPLRHCLHVSSLTSAEAAELGPLLVQASACVQELAGAEQVYVCLWSHSGWSPGHIHFVVQPAWERLRDRYSGPGPMLQADQFRLNEPVARSEVEAFCSRARAWSGWSAT
jgi:diadenosine tetraphosphate (Ap4A) HIT family hydrolase